MHKTPKAKKCNNQAHKNKRPHAHLNKCVFSITKYLLYIDRRTILLSA